MDIGLYNKYKNSDLSSDLIGMFTDLIMDDEVTRKVFIFIGKRMLESSDPNSSSKIGATINDMASDILVNRPVKVKGKAKFKVAEANLDRKRAERAVQSLLLTGLCYYEQVGKTKVIYCTERGISVLRSIHSRESEKG